MGGSSSRSGSGMKWARPYAQAGAASAQQVFNQNQPATQALASNVQGMVPGLMSMFNQGNAGVKSAQDYAGKVLSGEFMQGNPYLDQIIGKARSGISDEVNSQFSLSGRYGSGAHTGVLADSLADMESNLRYNDYGQQQQRMDSMAALSPTLAQADYVGLPEILQTAGVGAELPYTGLNSYSNSLGTLFNGGVQKQSGLSSVLGGIGSAATSFAMGKM